MRLRTRTRLPTPTPPTPHPADARQRTAANGIPRQREPDKHATSQAADVAATTPTACTHRESERAIPTAPSATVGTARPHYQTEVQPKTDPRAFGPSPPSHPFPLPRRRRLDTTRKHTPILSPSMLNPGNKASDYTGDSPEVRRRGRTSSAQAVADAPRPERSLQDVCPLP